MYLKLGKNVRKAIRILYIYETDTNTGIFTFKEVTNVVDNESTVPPTSPVKPYVAPIDPVAPPIPETGDGMGLFVFVGLALVSMLGMVVLKKREQF